MQINKRRLLFNGFTSALQVVFTAITFFFLYRLIVKQLGTELMGVWSLVIATSSFSNLANVGITSGLVKFSAENSLDRNRSYLQQLVFTALSSTIVFFIVISTLVYLLGRLILISVIKQEEFLTIAIDLLPYSLLNLVITGTAGVFTSVLDGYQKTYIKNAIISISLLLLLLLSWLLVKDYGIKGLIYAQLFQGVFIFIASLFFMFGLAGNFFRSLNWSNTVFRKICGYGLKFQGISIIQMLYEPMTKALLSSYVGLSAVAFYEMATRLVGQLRALIVNANQVIVPIVASIKSNSHEVMKDIYSRSTSFVLFLALPLMSIIVILANPISILWIGHKENIFITFLILLALANFINILCGPAYFSFLGTGELNGLLFVHVCIGVMNLLLGLLLGKLIPVYGVSYAWMISLSIGSIMVIYQFQKKKGISFQRAFHLKDIAAFCICCTICLLVNIFLSFTIGEVKIKDVVLYLSIVFILLMAVALLKRDMVVFLKNSLSR